MKNDGGMGGCHALTVAVALEVEISRDDAVIFVAA